MECALLIEAYKQMKQPAEVIQNMWKFIPFLMGARESFRLMLRLTEPAGMKKIELRPRIDIPEWGGKGLLLNVNDYIREDERQTEHAGTVKLSIPPDGVSQLVARDVLLEVTIFIPK